MQEKIINLLPTWFKQIPHFDKILHGNADLYINSIYPAITIFEREKLRPKIVIALYSK